MQTVDVKNLVERVECGKELTADDILAIAAHVDDFVRADLYDKAIIIEHNTKTNTVSVLLQNQDGIEGYCIGDDAVRAELASKAYEALRAQDRERADAVYEVLKKTLNYSVKAKLPYLRLVVFLRPFTFASSKKWGNRGC